MGEAPCMGEIMIEYMGEIIMGEYMHERDHGRVYIQVIVWVSKWASV